MTNPTFLPRVYSWGFRSGLALQQFLFYWQSIETDGSDSSFGFANKLWAYAQQEAPHWWQLLKEFPVWYSAWWLDLLRNDPVHLLVETTLLVSVVYMFATRTKDYAEMKKDRLSKEEEDDLIKEWRDKTRSPLASSESSMAVARDVPTFVVHKVQGTSMQISMDNDTSKKYQVLNFGTFDFLGMSAEFTAAGKTGNTLSVKMAPNGNHVKENGTADTTNENKENENADPAADEGNDETSTQSKNSKKKKKKKKKNAAAKAAANVLANNSDVSGLDNPVKKASVEALTRYGVGACGPRGFYGTIDPHLKLEEEFTKFMGSDGAILYSDGASTVSSTVAAFCKRGDLLVVDEGVREPLIAGIKLSRANIKWFKHNDMDDLRKVMESVKETDKKLKRAPNAQRRFIICEGLYKNTGLIAPLDKIVALKHEFHYRLILDESFSFGTLGETGRGALELYQKKIMHDAEVVTIALENSLGSIGGVTLGSEEIVDHQRLSGSGYCFSASSPPFTASAAVAALHEMQTRNKELMDKLNDNKQYLYDKLHAFSVEQEDILLISSDIRSPIAFIVLAECEETVDIDETVFLSELVRECIRRGVAMISAGQHNTRAGVQLLRAEPQPSIRMCVSAAHTREDIDFAVKALTESLTVVMQRYLDGEI